LIHKIHPAVCCRGLICRGLIHQAHLIISITLILLKKILKSGIIGKTFTQCARSSAG
jgi:hypothetical protein